VSLAVRQIFQDFFPRIFREENKSENHAILTEAEHINKNV
jgi:hypothetical protein